ncbi:8166_t:CDS:2 [Paraglomus occultum]|uniref:8166_t:CDS:1 n=1 Tax=Paraglomus occultum TaxID=144539 RepID=A0A9N9AHL5_9GLOM|nr:8166_t:CDS:2 [Paraglomus occultum]
MQNEDRRNDLEATEEEGKNISGRTKALQQVEQSEVSITKSLQEQLDSARKEKADLEASMEARAKNFQQTMSQLQINQSNSSESTNTKPSSQSGPSMVDPQLLKEELNKANEKIRQQESELKKLKFEIEMEKGHVNILRHDNQMLRQMTVDMHASAEQEEEYISNKLLKRISGLKKEKGELLVQVEQEEEYLTNTLQRKLNQLQKEKIDMENALEQEQEYIVNRLQKQLDALRQQAGYGFHSREGGAVSVPNASTPLLPPGSPSTSSKKWHSSHSPTTADFPNTSPGVVEVLRAEISSLRLRLSEIEKEYVHKSSQATRYKNELIELRKRLGISAADLLVEEPTPAFLKHNSSRATARRSNSHNVGANPSISSANLVRARSVSASEPNKKPVNTGLTPETDNPLLRSRSVSASSNPRLASQRASTHPSGSSTHLSASDHQSRSSSTR